MSSPRMDIRNSGSIPKSKYPVIVYIVHKCNDNALTLVISRTPKRLKTSYESTSEKAALKRRKTNSKYHFSVQTFKDRLLYYLVQRYELFPKFLLIH